MKLIKPSFTILEQKSNIDDLYKHIERITRICYKSEDKITEDSAKPFVDNLIKSGHYAALEHGTVYLNIHWTNEYCHVFSDMYYFYSNNPYSKVERVVVNKEDLCPDLYITTNYRVLIENDRLKDLDYISIPLDYHHRRVSVLFISDIGVLREFFRHRKFSMMQESTRFCCYNKNKFNNELTFILPLWCSFGENSFSSELDIIAKTPLKGYKPGEETFLKTLLHAENSYMKLTEQGWQAQQARTVLPLGTKSEAVMTGFVEDWKHFFDLRCSFLAKTGKPHPQASELADSLYNIFVKLGIINSMNSVNNNCNKA